MRRFGDTPRYSVHAAPEVLAPLADAVGPLQDDAHWRRADIEAGVPTVYAATADRFVPQTANLDLLGGISFDNGCYTGQEIIAHLHYLGQVKRRLFVARSDRPAPSPGDEIRTAEGTVAGEVVDAVDDGGTGVASVIVQLAHADATLHLADGRGLHLLVQTSA